MHGLACVCGVDPSDLFIEGLPSWIANIRPCLALLDSFNYLNYLNDTGPRATDSDSAAGYPAYTPSYFAGTNAGTNNDALTASDSAATATYCCLFLLLRVGF